MEQIFFYQCLFLLRCLFGKRLCFEKCYLNRGSKYKVCVGVCFCPSPNVFPSVLCVSLAVDVFLV